MKLLMLDGSQSVYRGGLSMWEIALCGGKSIDTAGKGRDKVLWLGNYPRAGGLKLFGSHQRPPMALVLIHPGT